MRWTYSCPHCSAMLNPDETVVLVAQHASTRILLGLDPKPGSYRAFKPPGIEIPNGTEWHFSCPLCHADLATDAAPELCALDMATEGSKHRVYFARTAGEQATFVVSAEGLVEQHGRDAGNHPLDLLDLI